MTGSGIEAVCRGRLGDFELDVELALPGRGVSALFGPSGSGKTSVLRCLAGLLRLPGSRLQVLGETWQSEHAFLPPHRRALGYVFQEASLFAHLSVTGNLRYGLRRAGTGPVAFDEVVRLLGLEALLQRRPDSLSGGERQRVAIGRALLSQPRVLLMDEPLAALDRASKEEILPYLERLHDGLAIPVVYVSHDLGEVERLADHMVLLESGRVRAAGALVDLLADPDLPLLRRPDAAAVLDATVAGYDARWGLARLEVAGGTLQVPGDAGAAGGRRRVRVLASDVSLALAPPRGSTILNVLRARIVGVTAADAHQVIAVLRLGRHGEGARLLARVSRKSWEELALGAGDGVHAQVKGVALADPGQRPASPGLAEAAQLNPGADGKA